MNTGDKTSGGEGGIRTLGTGVSPYNGLANQSFSPPSLVVKHLQSGPRPPSRGQRLSFGIYCAPLCAPEFLDFIFRVVAVLSQRWSNCASHQPAK